MNKKAYFIVLYWSKKYPKNYLQNNIKQIIINQNGLPLLINTELALCFGKGHCADSSYNKTCLFPKHVLELGLVKRKQ